jgi:nucleoid-associated protein YgaU
MRQNNISDLPRLKTENYENIFNVYQDSNGRYFYNLLQTVVIPSDLPKGYFKDYNVVYGDTWPLISYKNYNTPNLWWIITSVNNIMNPTQILEPATTLKVLKNEIVSLILSQINTRTL